jgi:DnaJ-domain-containing protein 1
LKETTVTELLRRVVEQIEQLPDEQQDAIAEAILRELEEREWDELVAKPSSQRFLEHLVAEAQREDAAGLTQESTDRW